MLPVMRLRDGDILTDERVWAELARLAARKSRGSAHVVVPYVTKNLLDLREGDSLACDLSPHALSTGQTNPHVLRRYLAQGVAVHRSPGLHAKVFVLGDTAVVGSANMSASSSERLREAVVVLKGKERIEAVRKVAVSLTGVAVSRQDLLDAAKLYKKAAGRKLPKRPTDEHPGGPPPTVDDRLWVIAVWSEEWPITAAKRAAKERGRVRRRAGSAADVEIGATLFDQDTAPKLRVDDYIIEAWADTRNGSLIEAAHPSQVVEIIEIPGPGASAGWTLVYTRRATGTDTVPWKDVKEAASKAGARLGGTTKLSKRLTDERVRKALLGLWPNG